MLSHPREALILDASLPMVQWAAVRIQRLVKSVPVQPFRKKRKNYQGRVFKDVSHKCTVNAEKRY